jgi:outer membrane protein TolC
MIFHRLLFLILFLLLCGPLFSEIPTFTVDQMIEKAMKKNKDISQAEKDVNVAEYQLSESYADLLLPQITANGGFSYTDPNSIGNSFQQLKIGAQTYVITNQFPDNYSAGISVNKTLFQGFKYWNLKGIQEINLDLAKAKYQNTIRSVRYSVWTNFYTLLILQENLSLAETADKNLKVRLDFVEQNYKKGLTNELDYLKAKLAYKSNLPQLIKTRNDCDSAKMGLCILAGMTNANEVEFIGTYYELTNIVLPNEEGNKMLLLAISNDLNLKTISASIATTKLNQFINDFSKYPTLSSSFNYDYNYKKDFSAINERIWQPSWQVNLNLSLPIDSWLPVSRAALTVAENGKTLEKLELSEIQQVENVRQQFNSQLNQLKELQASRESLFENVLTAKRAFELMKEQYSRGLVIALDLDDYGLSYRQADLSFWQAVCNYAAAVLKIRVMTGEQPPGPLY